MPHDLQSQLLFRGSGFFVVALDKEQVEHPASNAADSGQQTFTATKLGHAQIPEKQALSQTSESQGAEHAWTVVYVLADDDLPELARQGLW